MNCQSNTHLAGIHTSFSESSDKSLNDNCIYSGHIKMNQGTLSYNNNWSYLKHKEKKEIN